MRGWATKLGYPPMARCGGLPDPSGRRFRPIGRPDPGPSVRSGPLRRGAECLRGASRLRFVGSDGSDRPGAPPLRFAGEGSDREEAPPESPGARDEGRREGAPSEAPRGTGPGRTPGERPKERPSAPVRKNRRGRFGNEGSADSVPSRKRARDRGSRPGIGVRAVETFRPSRSAGSRT